MRWQGPAIVLQARSFGEADAIAAVFSAENGLYRGLARGAAGRRGAAVWQRGNVLAVRWVARLPEQLGSFSAELLHPTAALAMRDPFALLMLDSLAALAVGSLPEREAEPMLYASLVRLLFRLDEGAALLPEIARWEKDLLAALGYGLDFASLGDAADREPLFVSPRTGRAVSETTAGRWRDRLLPLPRFLLGDAASGPSEWRDAYRLTGHFFARSVFGARHQPLPEARLRLYDRVAAMAEKDTTGSE